VIYFAAALIAYLLGSIPFGFIAGRIAGIDVRQHGSGNIGATNTLRVLGKKYGYAVFAADVLKGFLAVRTALWLAQFDPSSSYLIGIVAALFVVVGHSFPVWLRFRGGKGVATSGGACFGLFPVPTLVAGMIWIVVFLACRYVSVASIVATSALPLTVWILSDGGNSPNYLVFGLSVFIALLVIWRHRENVVRLTRGTEPRFNRK